MYSKTMNYTDEEVQQAEDAGYDWAMDVMFDHPTLSRQQIDMRCSQGLTDLVGYDLADWDCEGVQKAINEVYHGPKNKWGQW